MSSFLEFFFFLNSNLNPNKIQIKSQSFFCSSFFLCLQSQPELCGSYHLLQSCFLSSSVSMINPSHLVAASFSSLALLSSSVSMANLSCLLATTFSSLIFFFNSFLSPCFSLLRVGIPLVFLVLLLALFFSRLIHSFLSFVLQSLKLCLLKVSHF